ncbi:MAG: class I fructose-bisphosphate aldolase [bacterium]
MSDVSYRQRRLFNPQSGRCLDIAVDHGFFGQGAFLSGIEDLPSAVSTLAAAGPDAIQLTPGQARLLQAHGGRSRPALVLRTDVANVYGATLPDYMFSAIVPDAVLTAVRLDAACVVVNLLDLPGRPEVREACIRNVMDLRLQCDEYAMPLMVEPLVMKESEAGAYTVNGDVDLIVPIVRQAVELGADVIKADPTDDPDVYHEVIRTASGIPVLIRGGGKVPDEEIFWRTEALLRQGAAGLVYGRNIIQHANPTGMTHALMAMLHQGADADAAMAILRSS